MKNQVNEVRQQIAGLIAQEPDKELSQILNDHREDFNNTLNLRADAQKAYDVCSPIVAEDKSAGYSGDLASAYWQVLLKLGKREELEKMLKKAATSGDRPASAAALVMRGDIIVAASHDSPAELKKALRDGYMRVVLMYQDPECRRERADALIKAAACFDKLGQAARAENLRAQAKQI